jgi:hypothetical protein
MADHSRPLTTSTYANFVTELDGRFDDLAVGLDPAVTTATNVPTNTIRYSGAATKWQKWNGSSWVDLAATYAISITGNAGTVTNGVVTTGSYSDPSWITSLAGAKISGNIAGNAGSATVLATARNINGVSFNGSANISVNLNNNVTFNNAGSGAASGVVFNGGSGVTVSYNTVGAPSTTGANASGTWGISISGNAATASTASTAAACSGNSATVTNGVYTNTSQTISGDKTFTGVTLFNGPSTRAVSLFIGEAEAVIYEHVQNGLAIRTGPVGGYVFTTIDTLGNFTAAGNITANSDERLKQNWRDLPADFLERLAELKMGIYDRKDTGDTQAGVSAQSMRDLLSPVVREGTDGMLSVAYGNAALVAAVELAREVVSLRRELNELKGA